MKLSAACSCICGVALSHLTLAGVIYFEGFNQSTLPPGWSVSNAAPLSFVTSSSNPSAAPYEGTHFVRFNSFGYSAGTRSTLTSPAVSTLGRENIKVVFAWHRDTGYPTDQDRVIVSWSLNTTNWFGTNTFLRPGPTTGWTIQTVALPADATNQPSLYVRFEFVSAYGNNCYLDAVRIEGTMPGEVDPPAALSATAVSATQINLQWMTNAAGDAVMIATNTIAVFGTPSNGVAYTVGDALPGGGGILYQGTDLTLSVTGLLPGTRYYFRAWSVSAVTNYSDPVSADASTDFALPILEGFNSPSVPAGWSISNPVYLSIVASSANPDALPYEGSHFVRFNSYNASSGTRATLTSPRFSTQGGLVAVFVDFAWHQDPGWSTYNDTMTVEWSSNGVHWAAVQTFSRVGAQTGWTSRRVRLPAAALNQARAQVRFHFLSAYGNNCYLDDVRILGLTPNIYLNPSPQAGNGVPGQVVTYPLTVLNLTGGDRDVNLTYVSAWPAAGPLTTGVITNNGSTNITVQVQIPASAIDSQSATTLVTAVTTDGQFTNTALLVTTCRWTAQPICEWFANGLGQWTNFFHGGTNTGWYWDWQYEAAAHNQERGGTNWLVSPAIDLDVPWAERLRLSFWFGLLRPLLRPQAVCLVTGNRNPLLGHLVRLADIEYEPGYWQRNEVDLTAYRTNVPVYLAFEYISTNPWQLLTGVCIDAWKSGIDNAVLAGPAALPAMTSYGTTPAITGILHIAGETGTSGPASLVTAQVGFGPQGTVPDDALWTWYPAAYVGAAGDGDQFLATPQLTIAGALQYCYRFRRGTAPWVYADLDGSANDFETNKIGSILVAQLPPQGALLRHQTISLNYRFGPASDYDASISPARYIESADDVVLPYDAILRSLRVGGVYWGAGRQNLDDGFWLRIYDTAVTNPGTLVYQQYVPGYACEEVLGVDSDGFLCYTYHVDLATPMYLPAGTRRWIALQRVVSNNTRWSVLDTPDAVRGYSAYQRLSSTSPWSALSGGNLDLGMQIYGDVTNAGTISGTVRDAESLLPIAGAQIIITNPVYVNVVVSDSNGVYSSLAPAGTYSVLVTKQNYLPAAAHNVVVSVGATTTLDFLLEGSYVYVTPTNLTHTMALGEQTFSTLVVSNTGPLAVEVTLRLANWGFTSNSTVAATSSKVGTLTRLPAIMGAPSPPHKDRTYTSMSAPAPVTVSLTPPAKTCYGYNLFQTSGVVSQLWRFTTATPGSPSVINIQPGGNVWAGDFIGSDFSALYALTDANQLIRINVANGAVTVVGPAVPATGARWSGMAASSDGTVYATAVSGSGPLLYTINPSNGAATLIGPVTGASNIGGLAISPDGVLYGVDLTANTLVTINKNTGAGTVVGGLGMDAAYDSAMDYDDENDILYLATCDANTPNQDCVLLTVNPVTGSTNRYIGLLGNGLTQLTALGIVASPPLRWARLSTNTLSIAAGGVGQVTVTFDASTVSNFGTYTVDLLLEGTFVNQLAPVPLKMVIPRPEPIISAPSLLDFGEVLVGDTTNLPLPIANIGTGVLSGQITAVAAPFSVMGTDSYVIPSGATSIHTIAFAPSAEQTYTNVITLTGGGGATVTLIGTGIPEPVVCLLTVLTATGILWRAHRARVRC